MADWPLSSPNITGISTSDAPSDAVVGGPAKITELAGEVTAIGADLFTAKDATGHGTFTALIAALWSAISGKASSSHNHDGTYATSGHAHSGVYDPAGSASTAQSAAATDATTKANAAQAAAVQRANHTGTQTASTISDFDTQVRTNRLDQLATPTSSVALGGQRVTGLGTPSASTDAATKGYADALTTATAARQTPGNRIAFIGDSLMVYGPSGWTVTNQVTCWPLWASLVTNQRCRVVVNAGVSGEQASQGLARFSSDVTPYAPTAVVIGFGTNEIALGTSFSTWKSNMIALVAATKAINATPILVSIPPNDYSAPFQASISKFNTWIRTYANANGIPLIDFYKPSVDVSDGSFTSTYTYDGGHANEAGHVLWAQTAKAVFEAILPPNYPLVTVDNYEPSNLLANGCFYLDSNSDGVPDSWTWSGTGSPSLVASSGGDCQGKWFRFGGSGTRNLSQSETVGGGSPTISVGDTIAVSGKVRAASMGGTQAYTVTVTFNGAGSNIKPLSGLTQNLSDGTFYQEYVVPSSTTSITVELATTTGSGLVDFAQVGLFNLTTLGT